MLAMLPVRGPQARRISTCCSMRRVQPILTLALALLLPSLVVVVLGTSLSVVVSTVAQSSLLSGARDVTVDASGSVIVVVISGAVYRVNSFGSVALVSSTGDTYCLGITCDTTSNIAYICSGYGSVFRLNLGTTGAAASTLASGLGSLYGIASYAPNGVLYVGDNSSGGRVLRVDIATGTRTAIATGFRYRSVCISKNGVFVYATSAHAIVRINTQTNEEMTLSGTTLSGAADGDSVTARYYYPTGVALNGDETALIITDTLNNRIRWLDLSTGFTTTIPGASLAYPWSLKWYCNTTMMRCGALVADSDTVRFLIRTTAAASRTLVLTPSLITEPLSASTTSSRSIIASLTSTETAAPPLSTSTIASGSRVTRGHSASATQGHSTTPTSTNIGFSRTQATPSSSSVSAALTSSPTASPSQHCALVVSTGRRSVGVLQQVTRDHAAPIAGAVALGDANSTTSESVVATPVPREELLTSAPLAANLSVVLAGGSYTALDAWQLVGVRLDVVAEGVAMPLLTANVVPFTVLSTNVVGHDQHLVLLVQPPNGPGLGRWLPSTLGVFRAVTLRLELTLRCPASPTVTHAVVVEVASPGQPQELASAAKSTVTASQYASWASVPSTGSAVGRVAAVRGLVLCSSGGSVGGLLPLRADGAACDDADSPSDAADGRGTVLGNLALWAAGCVLMGVAVCVYAHCLSTSLMSAAESLGVPSPLLPLVVATVPSTVAGTFVLLQSSCAADAMVAAVGVSMCVAMIGVTVVFALLVHSQLLATRCSVAMSFTPHTGLVANAHFFVRGLLRRRVRWVAAGVATSDVLSGGWRTVRLERVGTVVVLEYAAVWYLCVDVAVLTAASVLGSLSVLEVAAACEGAASCVALLYVGQLVLCTVVRPFTTLFSRVHSLLSLTLSTVSVCSQASYLLASRRDGADLGALGALLTASAVCDLVVAATGMLRTLVDGVDAARACMRHVVAMQQSRWQDDDAPAVKSALSLDGDLCLSATAVPTNPPKLMLTEHATKEVVPDGGDAADTIDVEAFWRGDGTAAILGDAMSCEIEHDNAQGCDLLAYFDSVGGSVST